MTPLFEQDGFIICFEAQEEDVSARFHFIHECGWTEDQFAEIADFPFFCAKVSAWRDGREWDAAYLGCCSYRTEAEFYTTYKDEYFARMVKEVLAEAQKAYQTAANDPQEAIKREP